MGRLTVHARDGRIGLLALAAAAIPGCDRAPTPPPSPGARLEAAAVAAGIVVDAASAPVAGSWARENARLCVVPVDRGYRVGVLLDYGERQGCAGSGTLERDGGRLRIALGACRFEAGFDGERIAFPAEMPRACEALCTGRAGLDAVEVDRLSMSVSEAETLRTPSGRALCAG